MGSGVRVASSLGRGPPGGLGCRPRTASRRSGGSRHQHCDNTLSPDVCRALCWPCVRIVLVKKLIGAFLSHTGNPNELLGQPIAYVCVFPGGPNGKEPICQGRRCKRRQFNPWVGKIPWRRNWRPTPVFLLENSMDRGAWRATVHGVSKSWTRLSEFTCDFTLVLGSPEIP